MPAILSLADGRPAPPRALLSRPYRRRRRAYPGDRDEDRL